MPWCEFADLLAGLNESTPLVKVAMIRTETDRDRLRAMKPEQRRMRADWQRARAQKRPKAEVDEFLRMLQDAFRAAYGQQ